MNNNTTTFIKETSPHLRRKSSVSMMMFDVIVALLPTLLFSAYVYQLSLLWPLLIAIVTMVGAEFIFVGLTNMMKFDGKKHTFVERLKYAYQNYSVSNILAPIVSAIIFTLIVPPYKLDGTSIPLYGYFIGALVGIGIGKLVFGGLGSNIFNPAAVGMIFTKFCWGSRISYFTPASGYFEVLDASAGSTALGAVANNINNIYNIGLLDMFIGKMPGTLGEAFTVTLLIGAIYLIIRRAADFRIMLSYLLTFSGLMLIAGLCINSLKPDIHVFHFLAFHLLSGGVIIGAVFMLTDPVTSPTNKPGRVMFGMIAAVITVLIRLFGSLPEGVAYSILIANMLVPMIEYYKWTSPKYNWKNLTIMGCIFVVPMVIMVLGILYGGAY